MTPSRRWRQPGPTQSLYVHASTHSVIFKKNGWSRNRQPFQLSENITFQNEEYLNNILLYKLWYQLQENTPFINWKDQSILTFSKIIVSPENKGKIVRKKGESIDDCDLIFPKTV